MVKRTRLYHGKVVHPLQKIKRLMYAGKEHEVRVSLYDIPRGWKFDSAVALPESRGNKEYMVVRLTKKVKS